MNLNNSSSKTLWIGEIDGWMDEKFLTKVLSDYAIVKNVKVIRDKITGMHQGYGFIEFESAEVANYILDTCNGNLIPNSNKTFKLNWATSSAGKMHAILGNTITAQEYTIYVCDLDLHVTEDMLREIFEKIYPSVTSSKLIIDPITKYSKGYGFVKFSDYNESQRAIAEMNGKYILSKAIKTNQAVWKKYNPESSNKSNNLQKTYQNSYYSKNNYYKEKNVGENNSYHNYNRNSSGNNNNQYYSSSKSSTTYSSPVYTQNVNIYLQSLYQQHYLNNVYLNQYLNSSGNLIQDFNNFTLDDKEKLNENEGLRGETI
jgi:RNA recognition motif-containing protein